MATTTTNYGWDIPQSTDLVKDGATAIATLGQDIDTSVYTALAGKKSGLVLLNTTSFSGVSALSLAQNTFTSTYTNYKLKFKFTNTNAGDILVRLRSAGSDNTTTNYNYQGFTAISTVLTGFRSTGATYGYLGYAEADTHFFDVNIFSPQETELTGIQSNQIRRSGANMSLLLAATNFAATTSFDSLTFYPSAGTFTGSYSIYGENK